MLFDELTQDNWVMFAIKHYDNPTSVTYSDFEEDLNRIKYIKRLLRRYDTTGELKTHLILNHIIVMYNCLLYTSPSPRDAHESRMPSSA